MGSEMCIRDRWEPFTFSRKSHKFNTFLLFRTKKSRNFSISAFNSLKIFLNNNLHKTILFYSIRFVFNKFTVLLSPWLPKPSAQKHQVIRRFPSHFSHTKVPLLFFLFVLLAFHIQNVSNAVLSGICAFPTLQVTVIITVPFTFPLLLLKNLQALKGILRCPSFMEA